MARVFVKVKARAHHEKIEMIDATHFQISVQEPPVKGKANEAVIDALADYFKVQKSRITLIAGAHASRKVLSIS